MRTIEIRDETYEALTARAALSGLDAPALVEELIGSDVFEHGAIVKTPGICGGDARIIGTRTPVWLVEQYRRFNGEAALAERFPAIAPELWRAAIEYARLHSEEIEANLLENAED